MERCISKTSNQCIHPEAPTSILTWLSWQHPLPPPSLMRVQASSRQGLPGPLCGTGPIRCSVHGRQPFGLVRGLLSRAFAIALFPSVWGNGVERGGGGHHEGSVRMPDGTKGGAPKGPGGVPSVLGTCMCFVETRLRAVCGGVVPGGGGGIGARSPLKRFLRHKHQTFWHYLPETWFAEGLRHPLCPGDSIPPPSPYQTI